MKFDHWKLREIKNKCNKPLKKSCQDFYGSFYCEHFKLIYFSFFFFFIKLLNQELIQEKHQFILRVYQGYQTRPFGFKSLSDEFMQSLTFTAFT